MDRKGCKILTKMIYHLFNKLTIELRRDWIQHPNNAEYSTNTFENLYKSLGKLFDNKIQPNSTKTQPLEQNKYTKIQNLEQKLEQKLEHTLEQKLEQTNTPIRTTKIQKNTKKTHRRIWRTKFRTKNRTNNEAQFIS